MRIITKNEKQTFNLGRQLGQKCQGGEVFALYGNLGSGKTVFTKGLAAGLGIKKIITSPTFVLMKLYHTDQHRYKTDLHRLQIKCLCHVDAYRLKSSQDLIDIGILDWLGKKDAVIVIEWADRVKKILPKNTKKIYISIGKNENNRIIKIV